MKTKTNKNKKTTSSRKEETYKITPKGIFFTCLMDAMGIDLDDRRAEVAWELFQSRMNTHGYIKTEDAES